MVSVLSQPLLSRADTKCFPGVLKNLWKAFHKMFKIWKTVGEIDEVRKMNVSRFETFLFAKLLWIALNWQLMRRLTFYYLRKDGVFISPNKLYKTLKARIGKFRLAILTDLECVIEFMNEIFEISSYYHRSEKKKNSTTWSYDIIRIF